MQKTTAEAWVRFFALSFLLSAVSAIFVGAVQLLFSPFAPADEAGKLVNVIAVIVGALFSIGFGVLYWFVGAGLWTYKPWSRIVMLVLAWLGLAFGALLVMIGVVVAIADIPELAAIGGWLGVAVLLVGLFVAAWSVFEIWLFQFSPAVVGMFKRNTTPLRPRLAGNEVSVSRAWALYSMIGAAVLALMGVALMGFGPALLDFIESAGEVLPFNLSPWLIGIGIGLILLGVVFGFIAYGLWRFENWARVATVVLAWIGTIGLLLLFIAVPFSADGVFNAATTMAELLYYAFVMALQIWLFQYVPAVKALFKRTKSKR